MPPTSQPSDPRRVSSLGPGRSEGGTAPLKCATERDERRKWCVPHRSTSSPLPVAHAWRIDRNRRGEFPMRGGSYLIHSPRVLPTPRGDYFTANRGREGEGERLQGIRGRSSTVVIGGTRHTPRSGNRGLVQRRDPNRSYRLHVDTEVRLATRTTSWLFFFLPFAV